MKEKIIIILKGMVPNNKIDEINFSGKTDILNEVGLDSLGMISFLLRLEEELGIEIDLNSLERNHLSSIDKLCMFLNSKELAAK